MLGYGLDKYKKSTVITTIIVGITVLLILSGLCIFSALYGETMYLETGSTDIACFLWPFMILAGLYGYLISLIVFLISFIVTLCVRMDKAVVMSVYMTAALCFSLFGQYRFFSTKKKTAICAIVTLIFTSLIEFLCLSVITTNQYDFDIFSDYTKYFLREAVGIIVLSCIFHICYTKLPDYVKFPFPIAVAYTGYYEEDKEFQRGIRKTRISVKISAIIIAVELLLGIAVAVFMMVLFTDNRNIFVDAVHQDEIFSDMGEKLSQEDLSQRFEKLNYRFDERTISYDIKMLLLMLCVGVPMAGIANFFTKVTIGTPLGNMADFMQEYAGAPDDKKVEVGRKACKINIRTHDEIQVVHESIKDTVAAIAQRPDFSWHL